MRNETQTSKQQSRWWPFGNNTTNVDAQFGLACKYLFVEMRETRKDHKEMMGSGICFFKSRTGRAYEKTLKTPLGLNKQKFNEAVQQYREESNNTPSITV